jgi:DNA-3-methyladenine glycosylase II
VKGVGVWTAHMFLMFTLRRPNILPVGDFGVRMAMYKHYLEKRAKRNGKAPAVKSGSRKAKAPKIILPKPEQMEKIAQAWEPYRSVACWYLWQSLDLKTMG